MTGTSRDMTGERSNATSPLYAVYGTIDPEATTLDGLLDGGMILRQIPLDLVIELNTGVSELHTHALEYLATYGNSPLLGAVGFDDWWTNAQTALNPDFPLAAARNLVTDKGLLYTKLANSGIRVPQTIRGHLGLNFIHRAVEAFGPRPILKPATGAGSRGVYRYRDDLPEDANLALYRALLTVGHIDSTIDILAAEYLGGTDATEVSTEVTLIDSEVTRTVIHEKLTSTQVHPFVDRVMISPPSNPAINATATELRATVRQTTKALGIADGALHVELRLHDGHWYVLDIGIRPGSGLVAHSVQALTGIDPRAVHLLASIGQPLTITAARSATPTSPATCIACCYLTEEARPTATFADQHNFAEQLMSDPYVLGWHLNAARTNDTVYRPDAGLSVGVIGPTSRAALTHLQKIIEAHQFTTNNAQAQKQPMASDTGIDRSHA